MYRRDIKKLVNRYCSVHKDQVLSFGCPSARCAYPTIITAPKVRILNLSGICIAAQAHSVNPLLLKLSPMRLKCFLHVFSFE